MNILDYFKNYKDIGEPVKACQWQEKNKELIEKGIKELRFYDVFPANEYEICWTQSAYIRLSDIGEVEKSLKEKGIKPLAEFLKIRKELGI